MPISYQTATGRRNVKDIKVSNGDGTYRNVRLVLQRQADGTDKTIWQRKKQEYGLVFTGAQYINTGIIGNSYLRVVVDLIQDVVTNDSPLFGSRIGMTDRTFCYWQQVSGLVRTGWNNAVYALPRETAPFNQRLLIDKDKNITKINGVVVHTAPVATFTNSLPMYLGSVNGYGGYFRGGTMYSCKIYDNDVLVRDFVPVPQGSRQYNDIPAPSNCMWDKVTEQYFTNGRTGEFGIVEDL